MTLQLKAPPSSHNQDRRRWLTALHAICVTETRPDPPLGPWASLYPERIFLEEMTLYVELSFHVIMLFFCELGIVLTRKLHPSPKLYCVLTLLPTNRLASDSTSLIFILTSSQFAPLPGHLQCPPCRPPSPMLKMLSFVPLVNYKSLFKQSVWESDKYRR